MLTARIVYHPPVTSQQALGLGPRESQSTERETLQGSAAETPDSCCLRGLPKCVNRANRKPRTYRKPRDPDNLGVWVFVNKSSVWGTTLLEDVHTWRMPGRPLVNVILWFV